MEYDKKAHIPQQVENFMNSFANGDPGSLERTLSNLKEVMNNTMFSEKLKTANKTKQDELKKLWTKAREAIKTASADDKNGKLFIDIAEIQKDLQQALNMLEMDYWETIRGYIIENLDEL